MGHFISYYLPGCHKFRRGERVVGRSFLLLCVFFLFFVNVGYAQDDSVSTEFTMGHDGSDQVVVATVNGTEITMTSLIKKMYDIAQKKFGKKEISPLVARKIKSDAVKALVTEELAYQKAFAVVGKLPAGAVEESLSAFKEKVGDDKAFEEFLKREGLTLDAYREQTRRALVVQLFVKREIGDKVKVTEEELSNAYKGAKGKYFVRQEEVQVTDIILFVDPDSPEGMAEAEKFRSKVINEYGGDPFKVPLDGSFVARKNISLNKVSSKERYDLAKKLGEGVLSHPVNVGGTLHLVQLTGYQSEISKDIDEVRGYLTGEIKKRKRQEMIKQWVSGLRDGADVVVHDLMR